MSMDLSSLNSIYSLIGSTYDATATSTTNSSSDSFQNFLLNALGTNSTSSTSSMSSLLDLYSNGGTNALLSGLSSSDSTSDMTSQLIASLKSSGMSSATNLTSLSNATSTTDAYTESLASTFQSQILNNMNAAKSNLQSSYDSYVKRMGENPTAAAKYRIEQMQQNINLIENYIASKSTNNDLLLGQQTGLDTINSEVKTSTNHSLVNQLNAKSAITQYMLNL
ncbi:hypothetical protein [Solibacillus daqui]|uniref:hypothetical protein n=1 Tax=Solibacillus daqui TaxID=2912187 RepID=UPI00236650C9|nr:hypothetical protein [Solibacillus daqui]